MGWGVSRERKKSLVQKPRYSRVLKGLSVLLAVQVAIAALLFYRYYPLLFPGTEILQAPAYWLLLVSLILFSTVMAYYRNSASSSLIASLIFYFALNSYNFLYYSVPGGDTSGEIMDISLMSQFTHLGPSLSPHFNYLTTPISYFYALILQDLLGLGSVMATIEIGYLSYILVLLIAVWGYAYHLGDGFFAYLVSVSYLILSYVALNNQFVPQLLALIFLFFLFYTINRQGIGWRAVEVVLFVSLLFTHPVFPFLYPLILAINPGVSSILRSYERDSAYSTPIEILLHPLELLRKLLSPSTWLPEFGARTDAGDENRASGTFVDTLAMSGSGATYTKAIGFGVLSLIRDPVQSINRPLQNPRETTGAPIAELRRSLTSSGGETGGGGGGEVDLLYELLPEVGLNGLLQKVGLPYGQSPELLDTVVTWGSRGVVVSLFGILLLAFLYNDIRSIQSRTWRFLYNDIRDTQSRAWSITQYRIEVIVVCALVFLVLALFNNTYGIRMLQIAFLPVAMLFYGLRKHRRLVTGLIVCLALLSPVLVANAYVNTTLTAGGNTIGYHETQAGQTIGDHYNEYGNVVVPPHTPAPVGTVDDPRVADIRFLVGGKEPVPDSGLVIHSDRLTRYLDYRECDSNLNPDREDVIYDNSAEVVRWTGEGTLFDCPA